MPGLFEERQEGDVAGTESALMRRVGYEVRGEWRGVFHIKEGL